MIGPIICQHRELIRLGHSGVCPTCGAVVTETTIQQDIINATEAIYRDFGQYGRHSKRCIRTADEWCCADDCQMIRNLKG